MEIHLYFSLIPEALIASNLPPEKFGQYYATGNNFKSRGQCVFFEVKADFRSDYFDIPAALERCVPNAKGEPKHSVYISLYRVLEHLPLDALGRLYLTTSYGHTLGVERGEIIADGEPSLHLYQDLAPVNSLVVSQLAPVDFYRSVTVSATKFVRFPALVFVELALDELATDPENGQAASLPYAFINHLREALMSLQPRKPGLSGRKDSKMVHRVHSLEFPYRMVKDGFYVGNGEGLAFYPMPAHREIRERHKEWWRSANV